MMKGLDLERIVTYPTWREMLMDIMLKENIDPWDIDIGKITTSYINKIKEMQTLELHIPANIILAAAILLRLKSNTLVFEEEVQEVVEETYIDDEPIDIPVLELRTRLPPKRRVTWGELLRALEEAFEEERARALRRARRSVVPVKVNIKLPEVSIDDQIKDVKERISNTLDDTGMTTFSALLKKDTPEEKVYVFLPLLYMYQKGELVLLQETLFGEIIVQPVKGKDNGRGKDSGRGTKGEGLKTLKRSRKKVERNN